MFASLKEPDLLDRQSFTEHLGNVEKIVFIDDDPVYQNLFKAVGESMGFTIKTYSSLEEMISFASLKDYDFAIFDYYLDNFKGIEIAEYADVFFPDLPVFLISADDSLISRSICPKSVKRFFSKNADPYNILEEAILVVQKIKYYEELSKR